MILDGKGRCVKDIDKMLEMPPMTEKEEELKKQEDLMVERTGVTSVSVYNESDYPPFKCTYTYSTQYIQPRLTIQFSNDIDWKLTDFSKGLSITIPSLNYT